MRRRIGLIALAVVLALVGSIAVYSYAHNADTRAIAKTRSVQVLYSQKAIPVGTHWSDVLKGGFLRQERVPVDAAPDNAVSSADSSIPAGQVATSLIGAGQIVVRQMFGERTAATGVLAIPKGLIAVSVSLPANADVAGFVQNGSQVAIFHTFKLKVGKAGSQALKELTTGGDDLEMTKLLLPRVPVIAVSHGAPSNVNGASGSSSSDSVLVTLAVSQKDAERLILGQQVSQLYLGLLSDTSVTAPDGGTVNTVNIKAAPISVDS